MVGGRWWRLKELASRLSKWSLLREGVVVEKRQVENMDGEAEAEAKSMYVPCSGRKSALARDKSGAQCGGDCFDCRRAGANAWPEGDSERVNGGSGGGYLSVHRFEGAEASGFSCSYG